MDNLRPESSFDYTTSSPDENLVTAKININMLSDRVDRLERQILGLRANAKTDAMTIITLKKDNLELKLRAVHDRSKIEDLEEKVADLTRLPFEDEQAADNEVVGPLATDAEAPSPAVSSQDDGSNSLEEDGIIRPSPMTPSEYREFRRIGDSIQYTTELGRLNAMEEALADGSSTGYDNVGT